MTVQRGRPFPGPDLGFAASVRGFLHFLHTTAVNKVAGLSEEQGRRTPLPTSPAVSPLGLVQHLTAVYRQHLLIHLDGSALPSLWQAADTTADFRVAPDATVESVIEAFDAEWRAADAALARADWTANVMSYGQPVRSTRLVVDVLQECARHVGHLDVVRELIDGSRGE